MDPGFVRRRWSVSSGSEMHSAKAPRQYHNNLLLLPRPLSVSKISLLSPLHSLGVSAWEARQHVSPYSLSLCHCGKSILNKPSEGFLCYTFHFPSSKLQGKLACQEDEREQAAEESNGEGNEKNGPTPTIKLTNHCS